MPLSEILPWLPISAVGLACASLFRGDRRPAALLLWPGFALAFWWLAGRARAGAPSSELWLWMPIAALGLAVWAWRLGPAGRWVAGALALTTSLAIVSGGEGSPGLVLLFLTERLGLSLEQARTITFVGRKLLHLIGYGLLAWFVLRAALARGARPRPATGLALLWAVPCAVFDEAIQARSPGRTGTVEDVVLDVLGMLLAFALQGLAWSREGRAPPSVP